MGKLTSNYSIKLTSFKHLRHLSAAFKNSLVSTLSRWFFVVCSLHFWLLLDNVLMYQTMFWSIHSLPDNLDKAIELLATQVLMHSRCPLSRIISALCVIVFAKPTKHKININVREVHVISLNYETERTWCLNIFHSPKIFKQIHSVSTALAWSC